MATMATVTARPCSACGRPRGAWRGPCSRRIERSGRAAGAKRRALRGPGSDDDEDEMGEALIEKLRAAEEEVKELVSEDAEDTEVWYLLGLCYVLNGENSKSKAALSKAKSIVETVAGSDASLIERIDNLLTHRAISESEKDRYWNPRWWTSGKKDEAASPEDGSAFKADSALNLPALSSRDPSKAKQQDSPAPRHCLEV